MVPEWLAGVHIAHMHFDKGDIHGRQRIAQGDAGVGESAGVDQDERDLLVTGLVDAADQFVLGIGLIPGQIVPR